jgi:hypothetical protein
MGGAGRTTQQLSGPMLLGQGEAELDLTCVKKRKGANGPDGRQQPKAEFQAWKKKRSC